MSDTKINLRKNKIDLESPPFKKIISNKSPHTVRHQIQDDVEKFKLSFENQTISGSFEEKNLIRDYLEEFEFLKVEKVKADPQEFEEFINFYCENIEYKNALAGDYIYKEGDIVDKLYFVFKGSLKLIKLKENETELNIEEYFEFLEKLYTNGESYLLNETMKINHHLFHIDCQIYNKSEIFKYLRFKKIVDFSEDKTRIIEIIEENNPEILNGEGQKLKKIDINLLKSVANQILTNKLESLNFSSFEIGIKKKIKFYEYYDNSLIMKGEFFGQSKNDFRKETVVAAEETLLGVISLNEHLENIKKIRKNVDFRETKFLHSNYFKRVFDRSDFQKNYFNFFQFKEMSKNEFLIQDGIINDKIFFLRDGEIEVNYQGSIESTIKLLQFLSKIKGIEYESNFYEEKYLKDFKKQDSFNSISKCLIFRSKSPIIIGEMSVILDVPNVFNVKVISNKVQYYELKYDSNIEFFKDNNIKNYFKKLANKNLNIYYEMIFHFKELYFEKSTEFMDLPKLLVNKRRSKSTLELPKISSQYQQNKVTKVGILKTDIKSLNKVNNSRNEIKHKPVFQTEVSPNNSKKSHFNPSIEFALKTPNSTKSKNDVKFNFSIYESDKNSNSQSKKNLLTDNLNNDESGETTVFIRKSNKSKTELCKKNDLMAILGSNPKAGLPTKFKINDNSNLKKVMHYFEA